MNQITTCSFFKLQGFNNKLWAFTQMQLGHKHFKKVEGLVFYKLLGSGAENGFSIKPNFGTYALLGVWESEDKAQHFFKNNPFFKDYQSRCSESMTVFLKSAEVHGQWDGQQPFVSVTKLDTLKPIVVLTRASIRWSKLISFWRRVGPVSKSLEEHSGLAFSIGIGEWPLIQQATISLWETQAKMMEYAYKNKKHKEVVMLTRKLNWYKEEMFARFVPYKFEGIWNGENLNNWLSKNS